MIIIHTKKGFFNSTDGVAYVAKEAGAFWLVDAIASYQPKLLKEDFQHWKLNVTGSSAVLICEDGNGGELLRQVIGYTDFPQSIEFYLIDNVLMLPSEY